MFKFSSINNLLIIICVLAFLIVFVYFKQEHDRRDLQDRLDTYELRFEFVNGGILGLASRIDENSVETNFQLDYLGTEIAIIENRLKKIE